MKQLCGAKVVVLHQGWKGSADESHTFLTLGRCPPCHKNNKHAAKGTREPFGTMVLKQNALLRQQGEPVGASLTVQPCLRCTVIPPTYNSLD